MAAPDPGSYVVPALAAVAVAWTTLRRNWDRTLLSTFSDEMTALRQRVSTLETEMETLRKELDATQSELHYTRQERDAAVRSRDEYAQLSAERAKVVLEREAKVSDLNAQVARLEVRCESLVAQIKLLKTAEHAAAALSDTVPLAPGDMLVVLKDGESAP